LHGHTESVNDADWSPNGKFIVTASNDGTARIWNAKTGKEVNQLLGHTDAILSVEWHPSGHQIVTASADGTAGIWDANTGEEVDWLFGHEGPISSAAWSLDGEFVLTASLDKTLRIWPVGIEGLLKQAEERITRQPPEFTPAEQCIYLHECDE
jgi:WD40 repeat protein